MSSEILANINRIIPFSNVDGPGNRLAIFFQSCPFSCLFCHNPETIHECLHCGKCVSRCPKEALKIVHGIVKWNEDRCIQCDNCIHACPHLSTPKVVSLSVSQILSKIKEVRPFICGITVSGGECMNQASFLESLFSVLKKENPSFSILIDSNGAIDFEKHASLLSLSDGVMLDVKAYNPMFHERITGISNNMVLKNLNYLLSINKLEEVRTVIFPNHLEENEYTVKNVAKIIGDKTRYKLLRYRYYGVREAGLKEFGKCFSPDKELLRCQKLAIEYGCKNVVIV